MKSDHWFHEVFRVLPDLPRQLIPDLAAPAAASQAQDSSLPSDPASEDSAYIFRPVALKSVAHHPDGVL